MNWLKNADVINDYPGNHGDNTRPKPLSEWSPEYKFMLALLKVLGQEGVSRDKAMAIVNAAPIKTIDDVEAVTTKLWRLGLEHGIPQDYLMKKLPDSKIR